MDRKSKATYLKDKAKLLLIYKEEMSKKKKKLMLYFSKHAFGNN